MWVIAEGIGSPRECGAEVDRNDQAPVVTHDAKLSWQYLGIRTIGEMGIVVMLVAKIS